MTLSYWVMLKGEGLLVGSMKTCLRFTFIILDLNSNSNSNSTQL